MHDIVRLFLYKSGMLKVHDPKNKPFQKHANFKGFSE